MSSIERFLVGGIITLMVLILVLALQRSETSRLADFLVAPPEDVVSELDRLEAALHQLQETVPHTVAGERVTSTQETLRRLRISYLEKEKDRRELRASYNRFRLFSGVANAVNVVVVLGGFFMVRRRRKERGDEAT
jgi:hypothetical protein